MLHHLQLAQFGRTNVSDGVDPPVVVEDRFHTSATGSESTSHAITLPSGIVAGELILVLLTINDNATASVDTGASGSNWNTLAQDPNGSTIAVGAMWKIAEGSDALTVTLSVSKRLSWSSYRISGATSVTKTGGSIGATTGPDCPSHSPAGGLKEYVWFAHVGANTSFTSVSSYPTNYTDGQHAFPQSSSGAGYAVCERVLTASSEDPGAYSMAGAPVWCYQTVSAG